MPWRMSAAASSASAIAAQVEREEGPGQALAQPGADRPGVMGGVELFQALAPPAPFRTLIKRPWRAPRGAGLGVRFGYRNRPNHALRRGGWRRTVDEIATATTSTQPSSRTWFRWDRTDSGVEQPVDRMEGHGSKRGQPEQAAHPRQRPSGRRGSRAQDGLGLPPGEQQRCDQREERPAPERTSDRRTNRRRLAPSEPVPGPAPPRFPNARRPWPPTRRPWLATAP